MLPKLPSRKIRDIRNERFGRLVVVGFSHLSVDAGMNAFWDCVCDCGETICVSSSSLRKGKNGKSGGTSSCGCLARESSRRMIKRLHTTGKHLYLIRSGPWIKIGRSDDPIHRARQVKVNNPYPSELVKVVENQGHREKYYHSLFADRHHSGEWFSLTDEDIDSIGGTDDRSDS